MSRFKVLITVTAYPLPSRSYYELVCTAGFLEDGSWLRIYPVPFKFLNFRKYQWVEINLKKRGSKDFRPESFSPDSIDLKDMKVISRIDTKNYWAERKKYCLTNVYTSIGKLIKDSQEPKNISLATFKPSKILDLIVKSDDRDWKPLWKQARKQYDLFSSDVENKKAYDSMIRKIPFRFTYRFLDDEGKESSLMIEDWEIGALYWNCLKSAEGDEKLACEKVKQKYFKEFTKKNDVYLFLGTTLQYHRRRVLNPFVIVGVFYPLKETKTDQINLQI